jgi:predicted AlkP superfamily phosphohydrolase/phosphomutase
MVMMTGKNPGKLGIYGFRHRRGSSYTGAYVVDSRDGKERTVWEVLGEKGLKSIVLGVPPSYPPKPVKNCNVVSCFITPDAGKDFTSPPELKQEVLDACGGKYIFDVRFRTEDREGLRDELFEMTQKRFDVAEFLLREKPWDFFMMHEIGFDRLHHAFWKFFDRTHRDHVKGNEFENVDEEYYRMVDERIGRLLPLLGEDCLVFILSDHGSKGTDGAFCINQWLEAEGYLKFVSRPKEITSLEKAHVDWARTKAWGWGGYYARLFFNVKGREEDGLIDPGDLPGEMRKLARRITKITDDEGMKMTNSVLEPDRLYGVTRGDKPDLMVYLDGLDWRSAGTVGHPSQYLAENDTGPDDSVHSMEGVFLMCNLKKGRSAGAEMNGARLEDVAPTLLRLFGVKGMTEGMDGRVLRDVVAEARDHP